MYNSCAVLPVPLQVQGDNLLAYKLRYIIHQAHPIVWWQTAIDIIEFIVKNMQTLGVTLYII